MVLAPRLVAPAPTGLTLALGSRGAAGGSQGCLIHEGQVAALAHARLASGPDAVDPERRIVDRPSGGPSVDAELDAALPRELGAAR
jgi:hypothetical protein